MNAIKILGRIARRTAKFAAVLTLLAVVAPLAIPVAAWCVSGEDEWDFTDGVLYHPENKGKGEREK